MSNEDDELLVDELDVLPVFTIIVGRVVTGTLMVANTLLVPSNTIIDNDERRSFFMRAQGKIK